MVVQLAYVIPLTLPSVCGLLVGGEKHLLFSIENQRGGGCGGALPAGCTLPTSTGQSTSFRGYLSPLNRSY